MLPTNFSPFPHFDINQSSKTSYYKDHRPNSHIFKPIQNRYSAYILLSPSQINAPTKHA